MQKWGFNTWNKRILEHFTNLSTIKYYTFILFLYIPYIQCFRKSICLEILSFEAIKTGGSREEFCSEERRKSDEES